MKDNEFKARNKDTDFSKKVEADTVLGRQSAKGSAKPFTSSEHNRYQQKFLDTEKPLDTSTVQNPSDSQEILKPTENNTEQQEDLENINLDSQPDIPYSPPTNEPPKSGGFSNAVTTAARNKRYQRKFNQKKFDVDITEHSADSTAEETQPDSAEALKDNGNYDFTEQTHNPDEAFDRVNGNSDFQLGADSEKDSADGNPKQPDKNRAYQKKRVKTEKQQSTTSKKRLTQAIRFFDRVTEKRGFCF